MKSFRYKIVQLFIRVVQKVIKEIIEVDDKKRSCVHEMQFSCQDISCLKACAQASKFLTIPLRRFRRRMSPALRVDHDIWHKSDVTAFSDDQPEVTVAPPSLEPTIKISGTASVSFPFPPFLMLTILLIVYYGCHYSHAVWLPLP